MKHTFRLLSFLSLAVLFLLCPGPGFAQSTNAITDVPAVAGSVDAGIVTWMLHFIVGNPGVSALIALLVALRIPLKALMTAFDTYAKNRFTPHEYATIVHYENGPVISTISWILDVLVSVKLPVINGFLQAGGLPKTAAATGAPSVPLVVSALAGIFALFGTMGCASVEKAIDPPLPGQTNAAPFVAFQTNTLYLLGHKETTNSFQSIVQSATAVGKGLVLAEWPTATNYVTDFDLAVTSLDGTYSKSALASALAQIPVKNANDDALLEDFAEFVETEATIYLDPLITSGTNSGPYITAGLNGITAGLGGK